LEALDRWIAAAPRPNHPALRHAAATRAHVLGGLGRWNEAAHQLAALASRHPADAVCHFNWGYALQQTQAWDLAEQAFHRAVLLSPGLDLAWYGLGDVLCQQGRWLDAEAAWLQQSALQPFCPDGLTRLVGLYVELGRWSDAEARLRQLKAFDPRRAWLLESALPRSMGSPEVHCT
jgi:tetratricopeptide (TPR) repeat protein